MMTSLLWPSRISIRKVSKVVQLRDWIIVIHTLRLKLIKPLILYMFLCNNIKRFLSISVLKFMENKKRKFLYEFCHCKLHTFEIEIKEKNKMQIIVDFWFEKVNSYVVIWALFGRVSDWAEWMLARIGVMPEISLLKIMKMKEISFSYCYWIWKVKNLEKGGKGAFVKAWLLDIQLWEEKNQLFIVSCRVMAHNWEYCQLYQVVSELLDHGILVY